MANPSPGFARAPSKVLVIEAHDGEVVVSAGSETIARSRNALRLSEPPYPPVLYIPFADVDFTKLAKTAHSTHCPYKGDASYWSVLPAGAAGANAMWAYETPIAHAAAIAGHGAFDTSLVDVDANPAKDPQHTPRLVE